MVNPPGETCQIAFKEWAGVCAALARGRQTIVLRKGGIRESEGPGRFSIEYSEFWLFPTWLHQAEQGLRQESQGRAVAFERPENGLIPVSALVRVERIAYIDRVDLLPSLEEFHVLTAETVLKRYHYRQPGIWVLGARVWRRDVPFEIAQTDAQAGCKTWVPLEEPLSTAGLTPALDEAEWAERSDRLAAVLDQKL